MPLGGQRLHLACASGVALYRLLQRLSAAQRTNLKGSNRCTAIPGELRGITDPPCTRAAAVQNVRRVLAALANSPAMPAHNLWRAAEVADGEPGAAAAVLRNMRAAFVCRGGGRRR